MCVEHIIQMHVSSCLALKESFTTDALSIYVFLFILFTKAGFFLCHVVSEKKNNKKKKQKKQVMLSLEKQTNKQTKSHILQL